MPNAFTRWLDAVPVSDRVDRRNARVIQILLLFLAITIPATVVFATSVIWRQAVSGNVPAGTYISLGLSLTVALIAALGFWLVRRGRLRLAVKALLGMFLLMLWINAAVNGFQRQLPDQLAQMLLLILAGLVLGRRALWTTLALLVVMLGLGVARDALVEFADRPVRALYNLPPVLFSYLLVAALLDRTTEALRESLRESNARGAELQREMLEREQAQNRLIHAQKKEITERMASGMAHDFNNLLSVIIGFAGERHDDDGGSAAARARRLDQHLASVEETARRGLTISRRLLRFSRPDAPQPEGFDAAEAIDELQPMLRQLLESRITLHYQRPAAPVQIFFERSQFELMLLNLASNARDAIDGDGQFWISLASQQDAVTILVADDGSGIPEGLVQRIFEPFFSTKPADGGTGLGLAVVHEMVSKAGGTIAANPRQGGGTQFVIHLPVWRPERTRAT